MSDKIQVGNQAFVSDGAEEFGAVRAISPGGTEITVYVENAGDFVIKSDAVVNVAYGKVTFNCARLDGKLRQAIGHAHDAETV